MSQASAARGFDRARLLWSKIPFKAVILIALFLQIPEESFPFSHFPMYASLGPSADYLYVTDGNDQPLALHSVFGTSTAEMKKMFKTRLKAVAKGGKPTPADEAEAARQILRFVVEEAAASRRVVLPETGLKLYHVDILRAGNRIENVPELLATLPAKSESEAARL